jgi:glycosyltransferase involved in cell wall biosynthesis
MFSIIMPVWNRSRLNGRALESILKQTALDFFEAIFVFLNHATMASPSQPRIGV